MVADRVDVFSKSSDKDAIGWFWSSDGSGSFTLQEAEDVQVGTKIIIHLKNDCREYADENRIRDVIKKYSNFVGFPIFLNGHQVNQIQPLWLMDPKEVTPDMHTEFYRYVGNTFDIPRYTLHYKTDVPLSIRALLYIPEGKPGLFEMSRDASTGIALYTRKVLIQSKTEVLLPKWLRFIKGVVDSEDIPLNLSRELLQNSALIKKLESVLTTRVLKFLLEKSQKDPLEYDKFYKDYGMFLKEGIVTSTDQNEKEAIAKLLRFESSKCKEGDKISIQDYLRNLKEGQKDIYYLAAPSRALAEQSPYFESLKRRDIEVLFCYEPYDELVLMQLLSFKSHNLTSVEKDMRRDDTAEEKEIVGSDGTALSSLGKGDIDDLTKFIKGKLAGKVFNVRTTNKLQNHP
jgi:TNF receptor-associated protein 1